MGSAKHRTQAEFNFVIHYHFSQLNSGGGKNQINARSISRSDSRESFEEGGLLDGLAQTVSILSDLLI